MKIRKPLYAGILLILGLMAAGPGCDCALNSVNNDPVVTISADSTAVWPADSLRIYAHASDADGDTLTITWDDDTGVQRFSDVAAGTTWWHAPATAGTYGLYISVSDGNGGVATDTMRVLVKSNTAVKVWLVSPSPGQRIVGNGTFPVSVKAWHNNGIVKLEYLCGHADSLVRSETFTPSSDTLRHTYSELDFSGIEDPAYPIRVRAYADFMPTSPGSTAVTASIVGSDVVWKK